MPLVNILMLVAVAELAINRLLVESLRPQDTDGVPIWFEVLDYVGLFLHYFAPVLAVGVLVARLIDIVRHPEVMSRSRLRLIASAVVSLGFAAVATYAIVVAPGDTTSFALETAFQAAIVTAVVAGVLATSDMRAATGLVLLASPLLVHYFGVALQHQLVSDGNGFDSDLPERVQRWGTVSVCIAAMVSPYCFAPRPLVRSLVRPAPLLAALMVIAMGATLLRLQYPTALAIAKRATGFDLGTGAPADEMALYLLALGALTWTIVSCASATSPARRHLGVGVALVALGGYAFAWPLAFLLGVVGLLAIADATPQLADEEDDAAARTPPIDDATWQAYVSGLVAALRARGPDGVPVNVVSVRGEHDRQSTVIATEREDATLRVRFERVGGALVCVDVVCGREVSEDKVATLTLAARGDRWMAPGAHPPPPPAAPAVRTGDEAFDVRFTSHGDGVALYKLLDESLRARAAAVLEGWLAYWAGDGVRWRLFPGRGAPLDHPVPLGDLVLRRAGGASAERLAGVIELVIAIAARGDLARRSSDDAHDDHAHDDHVHDAPAEPAVLAATAATPATLADPAPAASDREDV
ncbi:MAG: hypothetical protein K8W52_06595 [Deltaproteobacteria bacterium]|nr:hypothetical protein [Deltaproteobacteria bacterium]